MPKRKLPKIIVILGPTASGKTALSLKLAKAFSGEIVSADSRQVYRGMDIGTDKISGQWSDDGSLRADGVSHWMMDVCDPDASFTLADYKKQALECIQNILKRGNVPCFVGGTGLYIQALVDNYQLPEGTKDSALRRNLEGENLRNLLSQLQKIAPLSAARIDPKNKRRLIRALEVSLLTGRESVQLQKKGKPFFDSLLIGLSAPRDVLYERINARVDEMIESGLEDEVRTLLQQYDALLPALSGLVYKQMADFVQGKISFANAVSSMKRDTRRYARRQMTWFRRDTRILWISDEDEIKDRVRIFLST